MSNRAFRPSLEYGLENRRLLSGLPTWAPIAVGTPIFDSAQSGAGILVYTETVQGLGTARQTGLLADTVTAVNNQTGQQITALGTLQVQGSGATIVDIAVDTDDLPVGNWTITVTAEDANGGPGTTVTESAPLNLQQTAQQDNYPYNVASLEIGISGSV